MANEDTKKHTKSKIYDLSSSDEFIAYLDEKALNHTKYFTYTTIYSANSILENKCLWLQWLGRDKTNDANDKMSYKDKRNIFTICFSTGTSELLPMWYLYSGIAGKGARLEFPKSWIKKLKDIESVVLVESQCGNSKNDKKRVLRRGEFKVLIKDVLYMGKDTGNKDMYRIKYNNIVRNGVSKNLYEDLIKNYDGYTKGLIWFHEKETRIQVVVNEELIGNGTYRIELPIDDMLPKIKLRFAPELQEISDDILLLKGIAEYMQSKIELSDYKGEIKMQLKDKLCEN